MTLFNVMLWSRTSRLLSASAQVFSSTGRPVLFQSRNTGHKVPTVTGVPVSTTCSVCAPYQRALNGRPTRVSSLSVPRNPVLSTISTGRRLSSNPRDIDAALESETEHTPSAETEWSHPAGRSEDEIAKDPELRSLLCELASDFGRTESPNTEPESLATEEHGSPVVELASVNSCGGEDGKVPGFVAMTTEDEKVFARDSDSNEAKNSPSAEAARDSGRTSFVFNVEDIVDILREERALDICVIQVPPAKDYVDYFIVVTGRSSRHLSAMTQHINKLYKQKKGKGGPFLIIEGKLTDDWMCLDFGNIVVHFMLEETRTLYDLEKLWTLGKEHDDHMQLWNQQEVLLFNPETDSGPLSGGRDDDSPQTQT